MLSSLAQGRAGELLASALVRRVWSPSVSPLDPEREDNAIFNPDYWFARITRSVPLGSTVHFGWTPGTADGDDTKTMANDGRVSRGLAQVPYTWIFPQTSPCPDSERESNEFKQLHSLSLIGDQQCQPSAEEEQSDVGSARADHGSECDMASLGLQMEEEWQWTASTDGTTLRRDGMDQDQDRGEGGAVNITRDSSYNYRSNSGTPETLHEFDSPPDQTLSTSDDADIIGGDANNSGHATAYTLALLGLLEKPTWRDVACTRLNLRNVYCPVPYIPIEVTANNTSNRGASETKQQQEQQRMNPTAAVFRPSSHTATFAPLNPRASVFVPRAGTLANDSTHTTSIDAQAWASDPWLSLDTDTHTEGAAETRVPTEPRSHRQRRRQQQWKARRDPSSRAKRKSSRGRLAHDYDYDRGQTYHKEMSAIQESQGREPSDIYHEEESQQATHYGTCYCFYFCTCYRDCYCRCRCHYQSYPHYSQEVKTDEALLQQQQREEENARLMKRIARIRGARMQEILLRSVQSRLEQVVVDGAVVEGEEVGDASAIIEKVDVAPDTENAEEEEEQEQEHEDLAHHNDHDIARQNDDDDDDDDGDDIQWTATNRFEGREDFAEV